MIYLVFRLILTSLSVLAKPKCVRHWRCVFDIIYAFRFRNQKDTGRKIVIGSSVKN